MNSVARGADVTHARVTVIRDALFNLVPALTAMADGSIKTHGSGVQ
jgi:hypothetical protein